MCPQSTPSNISLPTRELEGLNLSRLQQRQNRSATISRPLAPLLSSTGAYSVCSMASQTQHRLLNEESWIGENNLPKPAETVLPKRLLARDSSAVHFIQSNLFPFTTHLTSSSPMQETPTKSTSSFPSRYTTPVTQPSPIGNHHIFATPAFLRPTALPIQSPQSPSLPWQRLPTKVKGLSALISDFRANQQESIEDVDHETWQDEDDEDELRITQEHESPGVAGRKPWVKGGAKRSKRRVISIISLRQALTH